MRSAQGVISKGFANCSKDDLSAAYVELFGVAPCGTCTGPYWKGVFKAIRKEYLRITKQTEKSFLMSNAKLIWNPKHSKVTAFYKGRGVSMDTATPAILEAFFNDPKREGLVIENPNYKPEDEKLEEVKVTKSKSDIKDSVAISSPNDDEAKKILVKKLFNVDKKTHQEIKELTEISITKIKKLLASE